MNNGSRSEPRQRRAPKARNYRKSVLATVRAASGDRGHACAYALELGSTNAAPCLRAAAKERLDTLVREGRIAMENCDCLARSHTHLRARLLDRAARRGRPTRDTPTEALQPAPEASVEAAQPAAQVPLGAQRRAGPSASLAALQGLFAGRPFLCTTAQQLAELWHVHRYTAGTRLARVCVEGHLEVTRCLCAAFDCRHMRLRASGQAPVRRPRSDPAARAFVLEVLGAHPDRELSAADMGALTDQFRVSALHSTATELTLRGLLVGHRDPTDDRWYWAINLEPPPRRRAPPGPPPPVQQRPQPRQPRPVPQPVGLPTVLGASQADTLAILRRWIGRQWQICASFQEVSAWFGQTRQAWRGRLWSLQGAGIIVAEACTCAAKVRRHMRIALTTHVDDTPAPRPVRRAGPAVLTPRQSATLAAVQAELQGRDAACLAVRAIATSIRIGLGGTKERLQQLTALGWITAVACRCSALPDAHMHVRMVTGGAAGQAQVRRPTR